MKDNEIVPAQCCWHCKDGEFKEYGEYGLSYAPRNTGWCMARLEEAGYVPYNRSLAAYKAWREANQDAFIRRTTVCPLFKEKE